MNAASASITVTFGSSIAYDSVVIDPYSIVFTSLSLVPVEPSGYTITALSDTIRLTASELCVLFASAHSRSSLIISASIAAASYVSFAGLAVAIALLRLVSSAGWHPLITATTATINKAGVSLFIKLLLR